MMEASTISPHNNNAQSSSLSSSIRKSNFNQIPMNSNPDFENEEPIAIDEEVIDAAYKLKLKKRNELLQRIQNVKSKRATIHKQNQSLAQLKTLWVHRHHQAVLERTLALSDYKRQQNSYQVLQADYQKLVKVNVLQDVFHIWHRGHGSFATINGLRIGMCVAPPVPAESAPASHASSTSTSTTQMQSQTSSFWNNNTINNNANKSAENDVPWHEINAAVGMVALLLHTLQDKLHIYQSRYMIQPRGSSTRVHSRKTKQEWDLFHQPAAFQFFAKRNWTAALNILGYSLYEVVREVERIRIRIWLEKEEENGDRNGNGNGNGNTNSRNEAWIIPFAVSLEGDWENERIGNVKVGGLDFAFNGDGVEWTKAMRYMAIDLKLIVAFVAMTSISQ
jgi:hypothetical protein